MLVLTDRGLYRPGEKVAFHGFARTGEDRLSLPKDERARVYGLQSDAYPQFAEYQRQTSRVIPVVELVRAD